MCGNKASVITKVIYIIFQGSLLTLPKATYVSASGAGGQNSELSVLGNHSVGGHSGQPDTRSSEGMPQREGSSPSVKLLHRDRAELKGKAD